MKRRPWTRDEETFIRDEYQKGEMSPEQIAEKLNRTVHSIYMKARNLGVLFATQHPDRPNLQPIFHKPVSPNRSIAELIKDQAARYRDKESRHKTKREGLKITMPDDGPYGIVFFGDPHLGDDGCDIDHISADLELVQSTPNLYGVCMGDLTNNWVGRLGRLYAHQHTTDDEEIDLAEWFLAEIPWLWVILGNHDKWSNVAELLCRKSNVPHVSHGAKFALRSGETEFRVDCRHTHRGNSMYNAAHAQLKQIWRGSQCHLIIGAHTHQSALTQLSNGASGSVGYAVRVGSYKAWDEYADANGFDDDSIAPSIMFVVNPAYEGTESFIRPFWTLEAGAEYLHWVRGVYEDAQEAS